MAQWAVFAGVTVLVLVLLLALARVSQTAMDAGSDTARTDSRGEAVSSAEGGAEPPSLSTGLLLVNVALSQGLFLLVLLAGAWYARIPLAALGVAGDPASSGLPAVLVGAGLGVGLYLVNELGSRGAEAVGIETPEELRESLAPDTVVGWLVLLGAVLPLVAVFEEVLFRAALVGALSAGFSVSPWLLALLSSVAFALGHGAQGTVGMVATGGLGFVLASAFVLTGSLLVVVIAHYLINALEFVVHERLSVASAG